MALGLRKHSAASTSSTQSPPTLHNHNDITSCTMEDLQDVQSSVRNKL